MSISSMFRKHEFTVMKSDFYYYVCGCFINDDTRIIIFEGECIEL
jgi:hypothetical protein